MVVGGRALDDQAADAFAGGAVSAGDAWVSGVDRRRCARVPNKRPQRRQRMGESGDGPSGEGGESGDRPSCAAGGVVVAATVATVEIEQLRQRGAGDVVGVRDRPVLTSHQCSQNGCDANART